jgi:hypothetical protein
MPTLTTHGNDYQTVSISSSARLSMDLVGNAQLKGRSCGARRFADTAREQLSQDLLTFLRA